MSAPLNYRVVAVPAVQVLRVAKRNADVRVSEIAIPGPTGPAGPAGQDGKSGALTFTYEAAAALSGHRVVTFNADGELIYASAGVLAHASSVVGVTTGAAEPGARATVQRAGELSEPSWSWQVGLPVYLGANGALTQEPPVAGWAKFSLVVGMPVSPTALFLNVGFPIVLI